jgi:hypothetical protein
MMNLKTRVYILLSRGISFLAALTQHAVETLHYRCALAFSYEARPDDIFVVSYPKAGTTVMQMMLYQLSTPGDMSIPHIDAVAPWFEAAIVKGPPFLDRIPSPRIFKTHRTIADLPRNARCIYVVRNVKDSCVSYFHHLTSLHGVIPALPHFVRGFIKGKVKWGSWYRHIRTCFRYVNEDRVLLVNYDDLCADLPTVVDRVSTFCGFEPSEQKRAEVIQRCSFNFMKQHNVKFDPRFAGIRIDRTDFIRKGISGDWVSALSPQLASLLDEQLAITIRKLGKSQDSDIFRFLASGQSSLRGTVHSQIMPENGDRFLTPSKTGGEIEGLFLARADRETLKPGDRVRIRLKVQTVPDWIVVDVAEVKDIGRRHGRDGITLKFVSIDAREHILLSDHCSRISQSLIEPDSLLNEGIHPTSPAMMPPAQQLEV